MNKLLLTSLFTFMSLVAFAQAEFMPGYFIDNTGNKVDCFIKNTERINNPRQFEYKLSESSEVMLGTIGNVQEFEILNTIYRFQRHTVDMDQSEVTTKQLGYDRNPEFKQEEVFLRVLVEGKASLYSFSSPGILQRFFYTADTVTVKPLVYKRFMVSESKIGENNAYRQQLWVSLRCADIKVEQLDKIGYNDKALAKLFVKYNECAGAAYTNYTERTPKGKFAFTVKAGANFFSGEAKPSIVIKNPFFNDGKGTRHNYNNTYDLGNKVAPQIGVEAEYIFPFFRNKWSFLVDPSLQYNNYSYEVLAYKAEGTSLDPNAPGNETAKLKVVYSRFLLPAAIRHYFYLNNNSTLFLNAGAAMNLILNSVEAVSFENIEVAAESSEEKQNINFGLTATLGYRYKNKFSIEAQYQFNNETQIFSNQPVAPYHPSVRFSTIKNPLSIVLGYRLR
jgi:hypothetical protein